MTSTQMKSLRIEELDMAIKQLKRNKAPGPDGTTAELYKRLDPDNRATLLDTVNECWNNGTLHKTMNEANPATIYKEGNPELRTTELQTHCSTQRSLQAFSHHYSQENCTPHRRPNW